MGKGDKHSKYMPGEGMPGGEGRPTPDIASDNGSSKFAGPGNGSPESGGWTRRDFLRMAGLSSGVVLTGPLSGCEELWKRQPVIEVDSWHKGVCRFCGTGCGIQIGVQDGDVVDVKGDPDAHNRGRLCIKGILNRDILYAEDRAMHPLIRRNGELVEASWEEAMSLVAERFRDAIDRHGPDSVGYYGSGQLYIQESYVANKLFKGGIGTNNVEGNPRTCMASAAAGYTSVFGADEPSGCYEDFDHADCFFITGSNTAECHPIVWERVQDRRRANPDSYVIVVDPRSTTTAREADLHLAIKPGTDVALYNAILHEFIRRGAVDREMVADYLTFQQGEELEGEQVSFADLERHLQVYSPDQVAPECGVSAEAIREAAYHFAFSGATTSLWTMGLNQQIQGTASNRLMMAMHLLTGHIGRPGATPFSLTGQPNAGGGVRDNGALAHTLPHGRVVANPEHRREIEELWGLPEGRINPEPGYPTVSMFQALERGDLQCMLVVATNPAQSLPNAGRYREAMRNGFVVAVDAFHPTETTELADVVLPSACWTEKDGIFSQSERRYHHVPQLVDPPGEARKDLDILLDLADRLGYGELFETRTEQEIWDEARHMSARSYYHFEGMTYERLKREPGIIWPCPDEEHPGTCRRYVPGEDPLAEGTGRHDFYARPDRRAVVFLHEQRELADPLDEAYPLKLTTGRILEHWHTMTMTGPLEQLEDVRADFIEIHPADARRYGIGDGGMVRVQSRRGHADFWARVTRHIREGLVFTTFHNAEHLINRATNDAVDPSSRQPDYKRSAVRIEPLD